MELWWMRTATKRRFAMGRLSIAHFPRLQLDLGGAESSHRIFLQIGGYANMNMKKRPIVLTLAWCLLGLSVGFAAENPNIGTWKLNEAKSKIPAGVTKNTTVVYEEAGESVKVIIDGTTADGKPTHNEWTGKFDGKDYPVTGDPNVDTRSLKMVNERTLDLTAKKDGKAITHGKIEVSKDGKTRTVDLETTANGKKVSLKVLYDKQ
jgi:hypothetical protein